MKKILPFLVCFLVCATALISTRLSAQESPEPSPVHVGTQNPYKIGTPEQPVYAPEYVYFLEQKAIHEWYIFYSSYFDPLFMDENQVQRPQSSIIRDARETMWMYFVVPGHENDIIDAVKEKKVQQQFEKWRKNPEYTKNPTLEEDCQYFNVAQELIQGTDTNTPSWQIRVNNAFEIKQRYPYAQELFEIFEKSFPATYLLHQQHIKPDDVTHNTPFQPAPGEQYLRLPTSEIYTLPTSEIPTSEIYIFASLSSNNISSNNTYPENDNAPSRDLQSSDLTISRTPPSENY